MHEFSVWAPAASRVLLVLPGTGRDDELREPMTLDPGTGWWSASVDGAGPGTDYLFSVDGGEPVPDPRSAWQPAGVHGPSRVFDPAEHAWGDGDWRGIDVLGRVFYELHVGTFTPRGTLDAAIGRLDALVDVGVDVVELLPVAAFPGDRGWGYDGVDLYAVHEAYGGPAALQRFADACHARGLALCLDVVYNHLGPEGNYLRTFGPYFTGLHHTPWGEAVNLDDEGSGEVRAWIVDNALRWFADFHVDCLRLDAVHALVDHSPRHLLAELSEAVADLSGRLGRPLALVAESDLNDPVIVEPVADDGRGMTAQWDDDVHHSLHALLSGERQGYYVDFGSTAVLARVWTEAFRHAGDFSTFRDEVWGAPVDPARHRGHRFVAALQNHDQIGNRAAGDRLSATVPPGRLAAGAALLLTSPFTPMLFMGEEWGASTPWQFFTGYPDPALADSVRTGRREEFSRHGWRAEDVPDPQAAATREASVLRWEERERDGHGRLLAWHRDLITLRRREPALLDDDLAAVRVETGDTWVVVHRGPFAVLVNLGPEPAVLPGPAGDVVLAWDDAAAKDDGWLVPADGVAVVRAPGRRGASPRVERSGPSRRKDPGE